MEQTKATRNPSRRENKRGMGARKPSGSREKSEASFTFAKSGKAFKPSRWESQRNAADSPAGPSIRRLPPSCPESGRCLNEATQVKGRKVAKRDPSLRRGRWGESSSAKGPTEQGSFAASAALQQWSGACAGRCGAASDKGAAENIATFALLRNRKSLLQKSGYCVAASYPALARLKFGNGQIRTCDLRQPPHYLGWACGRPGDVSGRPENFCFDQQTRIGPGVGLWELLLRSANEQTFASILGRTPGPGVEKVIISARFQRILGAANFAGDKPRRHSNVTASCMMPPRTVQHLGQLAPPEMLPTDSSAEPW